MKTLFDCYSRILIDNHITDLKPEYMAKFDPAEYVNMVRLAGVESAMVYASDHNGNCYYPSKVGHVHANCAGRDPFGEIVKRLREAGIVPVAYHTVIYQNEPALKHPEWHVRAPGGQMPKGRYRQCCPNNKDYLDFCKHQLAEILMYDVAGIFLDMTFWPCVCVCDACREKYGRAFPETLDWRDPKWVEFQRFREDSMAEFAAELTGFSRKCKPGIAVTHQFSPVLHGWFLGQSSGIAAASDYASGDFYGGGVQQRLACKLFDAYTRKKPYEFMTSRCVNLHDHSSTKSEEELFLHAVTTLANGGAYFFIDAINPDGTLERPFYEMLHRVVKKLEPFRRRIAALRPELAAETGLYFSMASCVNEERNGTSLQRLAEADANNMGVRYTATLDEVLGTAEVLNRMHIPYCMVTDATEDLSGYKALIVNRAVFMTKAEAQRIRDFVLQGGTLIATGKTSLYDRNGESGGNFQLADLFNVDYSGNDSGAASYLAAGNDFLFFRGLPAPLVNARDMAEVKGVVALPDFPAGDPVRYASIHSDPPGEPTKHAAWIEHTVGKGKVIYLYSGLLGVRQHSQRTFAETLFRRLLPVFATRTENLSADAELTLLRSKDRSTLLLCLVNNQPTLPVIPLRDLKITVKLAARPRSVRRVSDGMEHPFGFENGELTVELPRLEHAEFFEITILNHTETSNEKKNTV